MPKRYGCYYCFQTLDPGSVQVNKPEFLRCPNCQATYHDRCWHNPGTCLRCGNNQTVPIQIARPPTLRTSKRQDAIPIRPSAVVYEGTIPWRQWIVHVIQVISSLTVAVMLAIVATVVAVHVPRLIGQDGYSFQSIMEILFRGRAPALSLWMGAIVAALASAMVFYTHSTSDRGNGRPSNMTRFVAGLLVIAWFDLAFYDVLTVDVLNGSVELRPAYDLWIVQGAAAVVILLLTPLYRRLSQITPLPVNFEHSRLAANLYGWGRLALVAIMLILAVAYVSVQISPIIQDESRFFALWGGSRQISVSLALAGAASAALAIAAVAFHSPPFRRVTLPLVPLRFLVFLLAGVALGFLYQDATNSDDFLNALILGAALALASVPVQRTLS